MQSLAALTSSQKLCPGEHPMDVSGFATFTPPSPQVISIALEDRDKPQGIACFDFAPILLSLLDEDLMAPENLVLNHEDPTSMYLPSNNKIGEAQTGSRYRELYHELITRKNQLLVPIILYIDGTAIDNKGHVEVCPVSFDISLH
ncbi:hypothetical protein MHU86_4055 [Fragilaria crotonensis]|nr:hypothetical protein MHU86_4055 [Fragilaria crotonensis]